MIRRRLLLSMLVLATAVASCSSDGNGTDGQVDTSFAAQMASTWHYAGAPQRVQIGIVANDADGTHLVTQGTIDLAFSYLGTDGGGQPAAGPTSTASFVPVPGTEASGDTPTVTSGTRGVYEAKDVTFDEAGVWRATLSIEIDGVARRLTTDFQVDPTSQIPAPGMPAPKTENLTIASKGVRKGSIDSMADGGGEIPDPELHRWTIADASPRDGPRSCCSGHRPTARVSSAARRSRSCSSSRPTHPDRAVYIHIEIWKDYSAQPQVVNKGAADWLLRKLPDGTPGDDRALAVPDRIRRRHRGPVGPALRHGRGRRGPRGAPADEDLGSRGRSHTRRPEASFAPPPRTIGARGPDAHDAPAPDPGTLLPASERGNGGALHALWPAHLS